MKNIWRISFGTFKAFLTNDIIDASLGEKVVFTIVLSLLEERKTLTKAEVVEVSKAKSMTTYLHLRNLEKKGFIRTWKESKQFYSPMFIELTEKGLLTASRLRRVIVS